MRTTARRRASRAVARASLLAAVVVTLAGLLAMHGLSLHGTGSDGEHGTLSLPAVHVEHSHADDHAEHGIDGGGTEGGSDHTTMLLCAAFLLAAGALLLSGLWRRSPLRWFTRGHARSWGAGPPIRHRRPASGPPPEWAFSVIRC